jgi:hypothetical protein
VEFTRSLRYDVNASDLAGISFYWINDTSHFAIDANGVITNTTGLTVGILGIEVRAYDPSNNYCTATFRVIVQDTTDPTWDQLPTNQLLELGAPFAYNLNASDSSGISQWWINDTTHFAIDGTGVIVTVGVIPAGAYGLAVRAYDPYGRFCVATITVTVQDTVSPTWDQPLENQSVEFGGTLWYNVNASDLAGISLWWLNDSTRFQIDSFGVITDQVSLVVGVYWIEVRAYDPSNNYCEGTLRVSVADTTPPTWTVLPTDQTLEPGASLNYQLLAADLSGVVRWTINDTDHFQISSSGCITSIDSLAPGSYGLLVTAHDPYDNALTGTFVVTALSTTPPPPIPGFPVEAIALGTVVGLGLALTIRQRRKTRQ